MKKVFDPVTDALKNTSEKQTKTLTEFSIKKKQALNFLNNKLLELLNVRGILAS